jgi:hypothetical protein
MICPNCKSDTLNVEKDEVVCSNCGLRATLWEYNIWKKMYPSKTQGTQKITFREKEEMDDGAQSSISDRMVRFQRSGKNRIYPLGFFYLIAMGCIIGSFSGDILIGLILAANWVAHGPYSSMLANATIPLLFGAIVSAALLVWLIHEVKTIQRK